MGWPLRPILSLMPKGRGGAGGVEEEAILAQGWLVVALWFVEQRNLGAAGPFRRETGLDS